MSAKVVNEMAAATRDVCISLMLRPDACQSWRGFCKITADENFPAIHHVVDCRRAHRLRYGGLHALRWSTATLAHGKGRI